MCRRQAGDEGERQMMPLKRPDLSTPRDWLLFWLLFGTHAEVASGPANLHLTLASLVPIAAAWAVSSHGARVVLPLLVCAAMPTLGFALGTGVSLRLSPISLPGVLVGTTCGLLFVTRGHCDGRPVVRSSSLL